MSGWLGVVRAVAGREFGGYFATPVASVFLVIFLALQAALTFNFGGFLARDQADLVPFFGFLPWVFLLLVPALSMRLWAEERRSGTIELLLTLPLTATQAVLGKFLAAWAFCALALLLTFPFVVTVNLLGRPDNGVIATGYGGALLLAGAFLAVGGAASAATRNQVVAFVLAVAACVVFAVCADPAVGSLLAGHAPAVAAFGRRLSATERFQDFARGLVEARDLVYFVSFIGFWLFVTVLTLAQRRTA